MRPPHRKRLLLSRKSFSCLTSGKRLWRDCILAISLENTVCWVLYIHFRLAQLSSTDVRGPICRDELGCLVLRVNRHIYAVTDSNLFNVLYLVISMRCWIPELDGSVVPASEFSTDSVSTS